MALSIDQIVDALRISRSEFGRIFVQAQIDLVAVQLKKVSGELPNLLKQKQEAEQVIAKMDDAELRNKEAQEQRQRALSEFDKYQKDLREGRSTIDAEFKTLREKTLIEFEEHKKILSDELAKTRLRAMEELKKQLTTLLATRKRLRDFL